WLDIGANIFRFCARHGRDDQNRWHFSIDREGRTIEANKSIYVDGFALIGVSEFIRATGDAEAKRLAMETFDSVVKRLSTPGSYLTFPYEIPAGMRVHGISMLFSYAFDLLAQATGNAQVAREALRHADMVMDLFRRPERGALLEFVREDGSTEDSPAGRCVV